MGMARAGALLPQEGVSRDRISGEGHGAADGVGGSCQARGGQWRFSVLLNPRQASSASLPLGEAGRPGSQAPARHTPPAAAQRMCRGRGEGKQWDQCGYGPV